MTTSNTVDYGWKFMIVLKDHHLPSVNKEFSALSKLQPQNTFFWRTGNKTQVNQYFRWVEDISYLDSDSNQHTLAVIECLETKPDRKNDKKTTTFKWVTN